MSVDLPALVAEMRRLGIVSLEIEGAKILLGPQPMTAASAVMPLASQSVQSARDAEAAGRELTDDELLFASSMGWPEDNRL